MERDIGIGVWLTLNNLQIYYRTLRRSSWFTRKSGNKLRFFTLDRTYIEKHSTIFSFKQLYENCQNWNTMWKYLVNQRITASKLNDDKYLLSNDDKLLSQRVQEKTSRSINPLDWLTKEQASTKSKAFAYQTTNARNIRGQVFRAPLSLAVARPSLVSSMRLLLLMQSVSLKERSGRSTCSRRRRWCRGWYM